MRQTDPRIDIWLAGNADPVADPLLGMEAAGLFAPESSYGAIARIKSDLVERTGLIGLAGVWGGRQMVSRFFLERFGTPAQIAAWGGKGLSVAISEPGVGAHPKLLTTRAVAQGDAVRIDGKKAWVSGGPTADAVIVFAITAEDAGRKRYGAFLVPTTTPGLSMAEMPGFHALRPSRHCAMTLDGCIVPRSAQLGPDGSAYDRMALPFRDEEDAVGTFGLLGAFRYLARRLGQGGDKAGDKGGDKAGDKAEEAALSLGGIAALIAVFAAGAEAVVAQLDAGALETGSPVLVGLRVLATDLLARCRGHIDAHGAPANADAVATMLSDIEAVLGVARGPRLARQARLGTALFRGR